MNETIEDILGEFQGILNDFQREHIARRVRASGEIYCGLQDTERIEHLAKVFGFHPFDIRAFIDTSRHQPRREAGQLAQNPS